MLCIQLEAKDFSFSPMEDEHADKPPFASCFHFELLAYICACKWNLEKDS
jgi:hypothetical protein